MATAKRSTSTKKTTTARKTTTAKRVAPKKVAAKKAPVKKTVVRKAPARKSTKATENYETFKIAQDYPPIMSFKITRQTVYWVIIMAFVIFFQLWIIKLQLEVSQIINSQQVQLMQEG